ncbi:hypothetical protein SLS63_008009 [Diaporthe eres]|uniref:aldehyde dehydrogenase (NAD(+)) n=1 Tax=Diaporthe eres TaxID=83184 RepID=A0ABR1P3K0_DIAER
MSANIKTTSPSTNRVVCELAATSLQQAKEIAKQSNAAFKSFSRVPLEKRREIVVKALALIQERKIELGRELSEQMGRPISFSHKEIETMQKWADYLLEIAEAALSPIPGRPEPGFKRSIKKIPVGPTLIVFAWNTPLVVMKEETFGPVIPVAKVAHDDEAVKLMNDTDYGLTASVWTKDIPRGEELLEQLEAGTVFLNRCDYPNPDLSWTGWKKSGLGCTLGPRGFDAFVKLKSHHIKENQA